MELMSTTFHVGRCSVLCMDNTLLAMVVGNTLAFESMGSNPSTPVLIFTSWYIYISLQQTDITDEVVTRRFTSSTAVVHSAIPSGEGESSI